MGGVSGCGGAAAPKMEWDGEGFFSLMPIPGYALELDTEYAAIVFKDLVSLSGENIEPYLSFYGISDHGPYSFCISCGTGHSGT